METKTKTMTALIVSLMCLSGFMAQGSIIRQDGLTFERNDVSGADTTVAVTGLFQEMTKLVIPSSVVYRNKTYTVTEVANNAFTELTDLEEVTFPRTLTSIGDEAFEGCTGISILSIPDNVTKIGRRAFALNEIFALSISKNLVDLGEEAFLTPFNRIVD